jgi:hypothetical protein
MNGWDSLRELPTDRDWENPEVYFIYSPIEIESN